MSESVASVARARTFFGFNPVDFVDDIVCAMSYYISSCLEAISAKLAEVRVSPNHKQRFMRELSEVVQKSVNKNADLFELFVMRNIFHIDIDVDLAGALTAPEVHEDGGGVSMIQGDSDDGTDAELEALYAEIEKETRRRCELIKTIRQEEAQLAIAEALEKRLPEIEELGKCAHELPSDEVNEKIRRFEDILEHLKSHRRSEPSLEFQKQAFRFD